MATIAGRCFKFPPNKKELSKENKTYRAQCRFCNNFYSATGHTTTNLINHIKSKHLLEYEKIYQEIRDARNKPPQQQTSMEAFTSSKKVPYGRHSAQQMDMDHKFVEWIASGYIPMAMVDNPEFRAWVTALNPQWNIPSRRHISQKLLAERRLSIVSRVTDILSQQEHLHITLDLWTNRQMRGYLGMTGHYMIDWELRSVVLACKRLKGRHTAAAIVGLYDEVMPASSAPSERLFSIAGKFFVPARSRLTDQRLEDLIMIKCNKYA